jgi:hypothetical protein
VLDILLSNFLVYKCRFAGSRFSGKVNSKQHQIFLPFDGSKYSTVASARKAIEPTVSQVNAGTAGEKADATFKKPMHKVLMCCFERARL